MEKPKLKRGLGLFEVTVAGVGIILGAGIYVLIGVAAGIAGNAVWLSFVLAALIGALTGLSYAELSSIFHRDAAEYDYVESAFNKRLAYIISLMVIFVGIVTAAAVSLGFANYFDGLFNKPIILVAILVVIIMSLINYYGIKQSSLFNIIATIVEALGLLFIIFIGFKNFGSTNYLQFNNGFTGILQATALIFFAYLGFETMVKLAEETKNPTKTIPIALIISIIITSIIYILVSIAAVSLLDANVLSLSKTPLSDAASVGLGNYGNLAFIIIAVIALFSTSNTVLIALVTSSRMMYGMATERILPRFFGFVDIKRRTPYIAIFFLMVITLLFVLIGDIKVVASINNFFQFLIFGFVNLSLLALRYKYPYKERSFKVPLNIGKFNILAFLGFLTSIIMLYYVVRNII
ncbi:MAG: amino acid permease [Nanoarchaeota archaeon]